jgi:hypothetical protein
MRSAVSAGKVEKLAALKDSLLGFRLALDADLRQMGLLSLARAQRYSSIVNADCRFEVLGNRKFHDCPELFRNRETFPNGQTKPPRTSRLQRTQNGN